MTPLCNEIHNTVCLLVNAVIVLSGTFKNFSPGGSNQAKNKSVGHFFLSRVWLEKPIPGGTDMTLIDKL